MTKEEYNESRKIYQKERREWLKSLGYCPICGKEKLMGEEKRCPICLAKAYESNRKYQQKNKNKVLERQRARRRELIKNGLCTQCGVNSIVDGKTYCLKCLQKKRIQGKQYREKKGILPRSERVSNGLCYRCGNPLKDGKRLCEECSKKSILNFKGKHSNENHIWRKDNNLIKRMS